MNRHNLAYAFFLFAFLFVISIFQLHSIRRKSRFEKRLGVLVGKMQKFQPAEPAESIDKKQEFYPGDEGDWRIWGFAVEPRTLNPLSTERDIYTVWITQGAIFESLLVYDFQAIELKPHLAESYDISDDGLEITFTLRDDIYFTDGEKITSDDVLFTYETLIDPEVDAADLANLFINVKKVVRVSDRVVKFIMKRVYFNSLENVSFWELGVLPEHIYKFEDAKQLNNRVSNPVGSGPYLFEKWEVGREVSLRRNENYWGAKPKIRKIIYRFISNDAARLQALRAGQVDMIIPSPEQFGDLAEDEEFTGKFNCIAYWNPALPFYYIAWNNKNPMFSDKRVRRAMTHIIDREKIFSALLKHNGKVITGPFYHRSEAYDKSIEAWPHDYGKAKKLLDQAGWTDSDNDGIRDRNGEKFSFRFTIPSSNDLSERIGKLFKDSAAKVGIDLEIEPLEWSILISKVNDRNFDSVIMGWGGHLSQDPYRLWHSSQIGGGGTNYAGFSNITTDTIIEKSRRTLDEDRRVELYRQLHQILHQEQPFTFLYTRPSFRIIDKRFRNVKIYPLGLNYFEWYVPINKQKYK